MDALMEPDHDSAVKKLRRAIAEDPSSVLPRFHLATILGSRGLHGQAAEILREAMMIDGSVPPGVRFLYARQLHLAGDASEAVEEYQAVLRDDPTCEKAHLYIAQILMPASESAEEARDHARQAAALRPVSSMVPNAEFLDTLLAAGLGPEDAAYGVDDANSRLPDLPLGDILMLHPRASEILADSGIVCGDCAGYSDIILRDAVTENRADLGSIVRRLTVLLETVG
jgi:tetratricopeptide (TPR) repeat protein